MKKLIMSDGHKSPAKLELQEYKTELYLTCNGYVDEYVEEFGCGEVSFEMSKESAKKLIAELEHYFRLNKKVANVSTLSEKDEELLQEIIRG